jgi:hypothetical protein
LQVVHTFMDIGYAQQPRETTAGISMAVDAALVGMSVAVAALAIRASGIAFFAYIVPALVIGVFAGVGGLLLMLTLFSLVLRVPSLSPEQIGGLLGATGAILIVLYAAELAETALRSAWPPIARRLRGLNRVVLQRRPYFQVGLAIVLLALSALLTRH